MPTIEELQQQNLDLQAQVEELTAARDALQGEKDTLSADLERARELNQTLYLRVTSKKDDEEEEEEPERPSLEEYAKNIHIL